MKEKEGKIGILFGAGAEVCFCMPSGAEFAMMIFSPEEKIIEQAKKNFKNYYDKDEKDEKKFKTFGVTEYNLVLKSIIENHIDKFPEFNDEDKNKLEKYIDSIKVFKNAGELNKNAKLREKKTIYTKENFLSLVWTLAAFYLIQKADSIKQDAVKKIDLGDKLQELFKDSVDSIFSIDYEKFLKLKSETLSILLMKKDAAKADNEEVEKVGKEQIDLFIELSDKVKKIYSEIFDYQLLLNEYYGYLFKESSCSKKADSSETKKNKIVSFLFIIQQCIEQLFNEKKPFENTYYSDIKKNNPENFEIASTNYSEIDGLNITFLNGATNKYLDLKSFDIVCGEQAVKAKSCVPFIFPQTALKPLVSIDSISPFVDVYSRFKECEKIAVVGFGFNYDDVLLKSMFHKLILEGKRVVYFSYGEKEEEVFKNLEKKLNIVENSSTLKVKEIDKNRNVIKDNKNRQNWLEYLEQN
ncbi:hypothetical protein [uncultured Treponema sp.]|uniref:hypothetical protein n=1 Tax=uncultured Treponema sp. TaxID=162155 RepID=UPI0025DAEF86|nr:hypothetical protein [uncultured Treponema sp.]